MKLNVNPTINCNCRTLGRPYYQHLVMFQPVLLFSFIYNEHISFLTWFLHKPSVPKQINKEQSSLQKCHVLYYLQSHDLEQFFNGGFTTQWSRMSHILFVTVFKCHLIATNIFCNTNFSNIMLPYVY